MQPLFEQRLSGPPGRVAHIAYTTKADGDLSPSQVPFDVLTSRRSACVAYPWQVLHQVHSDRVMVVNEVDAVRPVADAAVTNQPRLPLAVHSGDCVPIGFVSGAGYVGAAHAGWKGLEAGVLEATARQLRELGGDEPIVAAIGPHIRADRYQFSETDLDRLAVRFADDVRAVTSDGQPACDLTAAVSTELRRLGVAVAAIAPDCTAADPDRYWSHRARREAGRIALIAWIEE